MAILDPKAKQNLGKIKGFTLAPWRAVLSFLSLIISTVAVFWLFGGGWMVQWVPGLAKVSYMDMLVVVSIVAVARWGAKQ